MYLFLGVYQICVVISIAHHLHWVHEIIAIILPIISIKFSWQDCSLSFCFVWYYCVIFNITSLSIVHSIWLFVSFYLHRVNVNPVSRFKKVENANMVVKIGKELKFSLVGVGGVDIVDGNRNFILSIIAQMFRRSWCSGHQYVVQ